MLTILRHRSAMARRNIDVSNGRLICSISMVSYRRRRAAMRGKRTEPESRAFKNEILRLRAGGDSIIKIAERLKVSKQYVSLVLIEAGKGTRRIKRKPAEKKPKDSNEQVQAAAAGMEGKGEYTMAGLLRVLADRRKANLAARRAGKRSS